MREIHLSKVTEEVARACLRACHRLGEGMKEALAHARSQEESPLGQWVLEQLLDNAQLAEAIPSSARIQDGGSVCPDRSGCPLHRWKLEEAVAEGVRKAYVEGNLRKSVVSHPLWRRTAETTLPVIHTRIVPGDEVKLWIMPKGFGSENKSRLFMLNPTEGVEGVKRAVVQTVSEAGGSPCPPTVVGIGVGGTMEQACILAKWALARPVGQKAPDPKVAQLEQEILEELNKLGIGPAGFGGRVTSFAVHMETYPTHIAGLPVAVNLLCHAARHEQVVL